MKSSYILEELYISIDKYLSIQEDKEDLFGILHFVQSKLGYIPLDVQEYISNKMNINLAEITKTIDISSHFTEKKIKSKMKICNGVTCQALGSKKIRRNINDNLDIESQTCFGMCSKGINISIDDERFSGLTVDNILEKIKKF